MGLHSLLIPVCTNIKIIVRCIQFSVTGDSAGGNLAMAVALALAKEKDSSRPNIKLQSLIYPALQAFDFYLPAYVKHADGPGFLRKQGMIRYWLYYAFGNDSLQDAFASNTHVSDSLRQSKYATYVNADILPKEIRESVDGQRTYSKGNKILSDEIENIILDPRYAPLMSSDEDLALLPSTYILNPEFDVLRDDGFLAAARLRKVGVPVEHIYLPGEEHGLINMLPMDNNAKEEIKRFATFFNKAVS